MSFHSPHCSMWSWLYVALHISQSLFWTWGTVLSHLVACLVGYVWVSELCDRQFSAFNMSIPLTKTRCDAVNLSCTLSQEMLTFMLLILALPVHVRASRAALFWADCKLPMFFFVVLEHITGH